MTQRRCSQREDKDIKAKAGFFVIYIDKILPTQKFLKQRPFFSKKSTPTFIQLGFFASCLSQIISHLYLVGGFNPSDTYQSKSESSANKGEHKKCLKPPPSLYDPPKGSQISCFTSADEKLPFDVLEKIKGGGWIRHDVMTKSHTKTRRIQTPPENS